MVHRRRILKIYSLKFRDTSIWRNFYFYRILNEKMEVKHECFDTFNNYRTVILLII